MIALALALLIASASALDCTCNCDDAKKTTTVDKCSDCTSDKCKTTFATECGSAGITLTSCAEPDTDNQFTCTLEQGLKGLECIGGDCLLVADPTSAKFCECKQRGADCARKAGCTANMQSESQVAACKKQCPDANYCNGAESMIMSTVALVAAVAFVRL